MLILFAVIFVGCVESYMYGDDIDPMEVDNQFYVNCTGGVMRILFRGDALGVYGVENPDTCVATEVEPAHFLIEDARTTAGCNVKKLPGLHTYSLEVIVEIQDGIRHFNDPVHVVTCNHELGGTDVSESHNGGEGAIVKNVEWMQEGDTSTNNLTLGLYDTNDNLLTEAKLGTYVQLRADMLYTTNVEDSFKVWHCRAFSGNYQYYIVVAGCGEGDIIKKNRGFLTTKVSGEAEAKSVYFRFFSLPSSGTIQFECNYIVCLNTSCVGRSCGEPIQRSKRELESNVILDDMTSAAAVVPDTVSNMPTITTDPIIVLPSDVPLKTISKEDLVKHPALTTEIIQTFDPTEEEVIAEDPRFEKMTVGIGCAMAALTLVIVGMSVSIFGIYRKMDKLTRFKSCDCDHHKI